MIDALAYRHETAAHQLRKAVEDIEDGDGIVASFDHNEETDDYIQDMGPSTSTSKERTVTIELTYLLPE